MSLGGGGTRRSPAICHSHYILHCTSLVYRTIIIWSCLTYHFNTISYNCRLDLFRGACAVKGNVQVAGHVKPAPFSRRDVTLGDVDGSLFHI